MDGNRVFVTRSVFSGNLAGHPGADVKCASAAGVGGLTGTFVAFVSTIDRDATSALAGSRGWVRTDGVPLIDMLQPALASGAMFAPIDHDERGLPVAPSDGVWTGASIDGTYLTPNCGEFEGTSSLAGWIGDFSATGSDMVNGGHTVPCTSNAHLLCFETGRNVIVSFPAQPITGRRVFISSSRQPAGLAAFDSQCTTDATGAGLPGTYRAAVATSTTTIRSRFVLDARPVQRLDGAVVAPDAATFLSTNDLLASVNMQADSTYVELRVWTGAPDPVTKGTTTSTCNDWASSSVSMSGQLGKPTSMVSAAFWGGTFAGNTLAFGCNASLAVICLEE